MDQVKFPKSLNSQRVSHLTLTYTSPQYKTTVQLTSSPALTNHTVSHTTYSVISTLTALITLMRADIVEPVISSIVDVTLLEV